MPQLVSLGDETEGLIAFEVKVNGETKTVLLDPWVEAAKVAEIHDGLAEGLPDAEWNTRYFPMLKDYFISRMTEVSGSAIQLSTSQAIAIQDAVCAFVDGAKKNTPMPPGSPSGSGSIPEPSADPSSKDTLPT